MNPLTTQQDLASSRSTTRVSSKLERNLMAYVAAGAASATVLASVPAQAKIVCTPVDTRLYDSTFPVDLNGDGIADINLIASFPAFSFYQTILRVGPAAGNGVVGVATGAADVPWGARIGPKADFNDAVQLIASRLHQRSNYYYDGPWAGTHVGYLGIKFLINGETHYGWARLTIGRLPATLTGYAYETIPNKPIPAGRISVPVNAGLVSRVKLLALAQPSATLALLARGADALSIWRRDEEGASQQDS
jgi:hypothetical protein